MDAGLQGLFPSLTKSQSLTEALRHAAYDELVELDLGMDGESRQFYGSAEDVSELNTLR